jgi:nucleotide-binding universal stress UspA family protein
VTDLFERVLVPVANEDVAERAAGVVDEYLDEDAEVVVVHVVQDEDAFADASEAEWEAFAEDAFDAFWAAYGGEVETEVRHGTDIPDTIFSTADDVGATAVAFVPRGGSRWRQLMSGDVARTLVSDAELPVVALPKDGA